MKIIRIIGLVDGRPCQHAGHYIEFADPDGNAGRGSYKTTPDRTKAKRFVGADAFSYWKMQSRAVPIRPDGKPNRPLTAFNIIIVDHNATPDPGEEEMVERGFTGIMTTDQQNKVSS